MEKRREIMTTSSSFEKMREVGAVYIDKTALIYRMATDTNDAYFLARPRRFGKSLLVSTLQAYFEGRRELHRFSSIPNHTIELKSLRSMRNALFEYHKLHVA